MSEAMVQRKRQGCECSSRGRSMLSPRFIPGGGGGVGWGVGQVACAVARHRRGDAAAGGDARIALMIDCRGRCGANALSPRDCASDP